MRFRKLLLILVLIVAVLLAVSIYYESRANHGNTKLNILVAPSGSTLKLDGHGIKSGLHAVSAGQHTVSVSKEGFAGQTETITATVNATRFVGIILQSDSANTANWYQKNDADLVQSINNQSFDQTSQDVVKTDPLLKQLPYIGPGLNYRVDYGAPSAGAKPGAVGIYVRYRTTLDKQAALQWIKDQGVDPSKMDIIYKQGNF